MLTGKHWCKVPYHWWGLSMEEVKKAVKGYGRLTNETYEYDGMTARPKLVDVGQWHIVAKSRKKLELAIDGIHQAVYRKNNPEPKDFSIYDKPKKPFKIRED